MQFESVYVSTDREEIPGGQHRSTGVVDLRPYWVGIPGTFFEVRGASPRLTDLEWQVTYGRTTDEFGVVDFELFSYGRPIVNITVLPEDRSAGDVVADVTLLGIGVITVRWGLQTPAKPVDPKKHYPTKKLGWDEPFFEGKAWDEAPGVGLPPLPPPQKALTSGQVYGGDKPDWWLEMNAEGYTDLDVQDILDGKDVEPSGRHRADEEPDVWDEENMTPEEFQRYMASLAGPVREDERPKMTGKAKERRRRRWSRNRRKKGLDNGTQDL